MIATELILHIVYSKRIGNYCGFCIYRNLKDEDKDKDKDIYIYI